MVPADHFQPAESERLASRDVEGCLNLKMPSLPNRSGLQAATWRDAEPQDA